MSPTTAAPSIATAISAFVQGGTLSLGGCFCSKTTKPVWKISAFGVLISIRRMLYLSVFVNADSERGPSGISLSDDDNRRCVTVAFKTNSVHPSKPQERKEDNEKKKKVFGSTIPAALNACEVCAVPWECRESYTVVNMNFRNKWCEPSLSRTGAVSKADGNDAACCCFPS
uniref:Uncharacterized protein n=1 Tax=Knipowitschia caucasica TaxID=637954 RepID=A0AAV2K172_KNICA